MDRIWPGGTVGEIRSTCTYRRSAKRSVQIGPCRGRSRAEAIACSEVGWLDNRAWRPPGWLLPRCPIRGATWHPSGEQPPPARRPRETPAPFTSLTVSSGLTHHFMGNQTIAREFAERALRQPHLLDPASGIGFQVETPVAMGALLARILWLSGFPDQATAAANEAVAAAVTSRPFVFHLLPGGAGRAAGRAVDRRYGRGPARARSARRSCRRNRSAWSSACRRSRAY